MRIGSAGLHLVFAVVLTVVSSSAAFSQTEKKVAYGILLDNSGSLRSQFSLVVNLGKAIVAKTHERGPVTLFAFNSSGKNSSGPLVVVSGPKWTQDKTLLDKYIESIFVVGGQTTLVDAIDTIASQLNTKVTFDKDAFVEKVIFLITDGEERASHLSERDLLKRLKASGVKVYAVGLVQELENEGGLVRRPAKQRAITFLEKITKETGGRAVIPKSKKVDLEAVMNELFAVSPAEK